MANELLPRQEIQAFRAEGLGVATPPPQAIEIKKPIIAARSPKKSFFPQQEVRLALNNLRDQVESFPQWLSDLADVESDSYSSYIKSREVNRGIFFGLGIATGISLSIMVAKLPEVYHQLTNELTHLYSNQPGLRMFEELPNIVDLRNSQSSTQKNSQVR
jgi:hypothetical protein